MEDGLPLWPPVLFFLLGLIGYAWSRWESYKFDKRWPPETYMNRPKDAPGPRPGE